MNSPLYRILPFGIFMAFIGIDELARFLSLKGILPLNNTSLHYLYPVKALTVGFILYAFRKYYLEINFNDFRKLRITFLSILTGLVVFILWINMDWLLPFQNKPTGFDLTQFNTGPERIFMIISRLFGAVIVVPIMEELFWRSFLIRYIIDQDFSSVPIGHFTLVSFSISTLLFGFEHHLILAGIMAGIAYNVLLYYTRSIAHCILAHALTNLLLGVYVMNTGAWQFW